MQNELILNENNIENPKSQIEMPGLHGNQMTIGNKRDFVRKINLSN